MKKVIYTADLHYGITSTETLQQFAHAVNSENPHVIILGGDIAEHRLGSGLIVDMLKMFVAQDAVLVIPGNHDLWVLPDSEINSRMVYDSELPQIVTDAGAVWLESHNYYVDNIAFVGSYLHYDYSAKDTEGAFAGCTNKFFALNKKHVNADAIYLTGIDDIEFANTISDQFLNRLQAADNDQNVRSIIVSTHCPCYPNHVVRKPHNAMWSLGTPFFYNLSVWPKVNNTTKVTHVCSGHSHFEQSDDVIFADGHIAKVLVVGSDYGLPRYVMFDV